MLESQSLALPKSAVAPRRKGRSTASEGNKSNVNGISDSDAELIDESASFDPKLRATLYKSFSTSDLIGTYIS